MGHQIIRQPDGQLCVFSSGTDTIIIAGASAVQLADYYASHAAEDSRLRIKRITDAVLVGKARKVYYQFAMTYAEAVEEHRRRSGDESLICAESDDVLTPDLLPE